MKLFCDLAIALGKVKHKSTNSHVPSQEVRVASFDTDGKSPWYLNEYGYSKMLVRNNQ
jgi:hypothetical protein